MGIWGQRLKFNILHAYEVLQAMKKVSLIFLFAFAFFMLNSQTVSGETFAPVDMYISAGSNGQLKIEEPSGSSV